jgi:hypothetical protein
MVPKQMRLMKRSAWSREVVAIAIREDGRRVPTRMLAPTADVSLLESLKAFGLGLLALITGSRQGVWRDTEDHRR